MNGGNVRPMATYRLQFNQDFRLSDAQALAAYFSRLGITHVYASPLLRAREGSTHGYDVVDPKTLNPTLGDETDLQKLASDLQQLGLGLLLDIVPNHTAASIENPYWRDVLTYGHSSPFAGWFDIDWRMPDPDMWGRVLVPVLGAPRSRVLQQDQIRLVWSDGRFLVEYFDHVFPVDPATVPAICEFGLQDLRASLPADHPAVDNLAAILKQLKRLPKSAARLRRRVDIDREEAEQWLAQLAQLVVQSPRIEQWAQETAARFGRGDDGRRRLKSLLDNQPYRLVHWRAAARTINYRRFFDINELVSVRQEDPQVFEETHATVFRWVEQGLVDALRIDHIDGLRDPLGYLERLAEHPANGRRAHRPLPVFVEKILAADEKLPCGWPVAGTTGYEFLNQAEAVFVSPGGFARLEELYRRLLRRPVRFEQVATWGKRRVLRHDLSPQVGRLAETLLRLASSRPSAAPPSPAADTAGAESGRPAHREIPAPADAGERNPASAPSVAATLVNHPEPTSRDLADAIVEVVAALPVYRTYVDSNDCHLNDADRRYVESALQAARRSGRAAPEAIDLLGNVLLLENKDELPEHELHDRVNFIQRFQQLSGPAAAKGIEDTALYAYVPLVSLNEVGGEPHVPDDAVARLHQANEERRAAWPDTMLGVTTHDTKRTADVRARLDVLSEVPRLWSALTRRWQRLHRSYRSRVAGKHAPDAAAEYLFYQTVVGIWPAPDPSDPHRLPPPERLTELRERIEAYMLKAVREAKTRTSWTDSQAPYEDAVMSFVRSLLPGDESSSSPFLADVQNLVARIARPGFWNSLSRTLLQFTAPGSPDLYQGDELWNFALVDPDNRRPVDYELRKRLLDELIMISEEAGESRQHLLRDLVEHPEDGRIKLHVMHNALTARGNHPRLFGNGPYLPLTAAGTARDHVLAFARLPDTIHDEPDAGETAVEEAAIVVAPRLTATLHSSATAAPIGEAVWSDTFVHLPEVLQGREWRCAITRERLPGSSGPQLAAARVLDSFPVALLISSE